MTEIETESRYVHHKRVKRGKHKRKHNSASGYYALPIPPLPQNVAKDRMRLLTRPNQKLINLANGINRRQGILPPTVNYIPPKYEPDVEDPFHLMPPPHSNILGQNNYPNSIQDVMSQLHDFDEKPPSDEKYPPIYDAPPPLEYPEFTHKPQPIPQILTPTDIFKHVLKTGPEKFMKLS